MSKVSWRYVPGCVCPYCHGAVEWATESVIDSSSERGYTRVKAPIFVESDEQLYPDDQEVYITISRRGHEETVKKRYKHKLDVECNRCNKMLSSFSLVKGEPTEYPYDYFEKEDINDGSNS